MCHVMEIHCIPTFWFRTRRKNRLQMLDQGKRILTDIEQPSTTLESCDNGFLLVRVASVNPQWTRSKRAR